MYGHAGLKTLGSGGSGSSRKGLRRASSPPLVRFFAYVPMHRPEKPAQIIVSSQFGWLLGAFGKNDLEKRNPGEPEALRARC